MLKIAVVGGSIGGLCAAIALRGVGFDVDVYERSSGEMTSRGAGIVAQPQLLRLLHDWGAPDLPTTSCLYRRHLLPDGREGVTSEVPLRLASWYAIHRTLLGIFPAARYHSGATMMGFEQTTSGVFARFAERADIKADLLVCADGSRSGARRRLLPEVHPRYAGYVAWRGTLEEGKADPELVRFFDQSFTISEGRSGGHILCYIIPGSDAATEIGRRQLNWVWYVNVSAGRSLWRLLTDKQGVLHETSVPAGMMPTGLIAEMRAAASRELHPSFVELVRQTPDPFIQAIVDVVVSRMAFDRVCLVGDAAFVLRPHPAAATAKAAADAMALAEAVSANPDDPPSALRAWQQRQLKYGKALADQAISLGKRSVERRTGSRTIEDVVERFRGISPSIPLAFPKPNGIGGQR